ncbi:MAG: nickel pincer cofactor biosynthesis protein LarC [Desulfitobacteriia bacterium]|jgi:uncharacterized protein (TIGR00299 family) protein
MKIAYLDCFAGISGDMILGALVDAGLDFEQLTADLGKLPLQGYQLEKKAVQKHGIGGTKIKVTAAHEHEHRHLSDIQKIILDSTLPDTVKQQSIRIFTRLAEAEAKVHHTTPDSVHFHEVGAVDAIIDIVGAVSGFWRLGLEKIYASALQTGKGWTKSAHGVIPVPAPATLELLHHVPVYSQGIEKELVTPTGAAILTEFCHDFGPMPLMIIEQTGYGAGDFDLEIPNLLRICIGKLLAENDCHQHHNTGIPSKVHRTSALMMEVNIDDMNPEFYDHLMNKLLRAGAMDVFLHQIQMKKNRPASKLGILMKPEQEKKFCEIIFEETTSLGVRTYPVSKIHQPYEIVSVETELGSARVKIVRYNGKVYNIAPEYEDCRSLAEQHGFPLKKVYDLVKCRATRLLDSVEKAEDHPHK